ncbi:MAG TPA: hypothetical protein PKH78_13990, partial [Candidatus Obscuribacter sp.]|nr:hypothetical protein [Candidatus Obscuribacter sp.]
EYIERSQPGAEDGEQYQRRQDQSGIRVQIAPPAKIGTILLEQPFHTFGVVRQRQPSHLDSRQWAFYEENHRPNGCFFTGL